MSQGSVHELIQANMTSRTAPGVNPELSGLGTADIYGSRGNVGRKLASGAFTVLIGAGVLIMNSSHEQPASAREVAESIQEHSLESLADRLPTMDKVAWSENGVALDNTAEVVQLTDQGASPCGERLSLNDITTFMTTKPGEAMRRPESAAEHLLTRPTLSENLAKHYEQGHYQGSKGNMLDWVTKHKVTGTELPGSDQSRYVKFLESAEIVQSNTSFTAENHNCPDGETIESVGPQTFEKGEFFWAINMTDAELTKMLADTGLEKADLILLTTTNATGKPINSIVVNRALCDNPLEQIEMDTPTARTVLSTPPTLPPLIATIPPTSTEASTSTSSTSTTSTPSTSSTTSTSSTSTTSTSSTSTTSTPSTSTTLPTTTTTRPEVTVPAPPPIGGPGDPGNPDEDDDPDNNTTTSTTIAPSTTTIPGTSIPVTIPGNTTTVPTAPYEG